MANKGKNSQAAVRGSTARATGYIAQAGKMRGDQAKVSSNPTTNPRVPRQAAVNRGTATQYNAGTQRMGRTSTPSPKYNKNSAQPRASQNTMRGKGTSAG